MKPNKLLYLLLFLLIYNIPFYAQKKGVGFGTDNPEATAHVKGNMRVRNPLTLSNEEKLTNNNYSPLYWNYNTKEIVTSNKTETTYLTGIIKYSSGGSHTQIDLNPKKFELFIIGISISNSENLSEEQKNNYSVVVKNTDADRLPIKTFELQKDEDKYIFNAFFKNSGGDGLYYYDSTNNSIITPTEGKKPIWEASFIAINKNQLFNYLNVTVDYQTYWGCPTCGGRYGIELGKYINENLELLINDDSSTPIEKTVSATENTSLE